MAIQPINANILKNETDALLKGIHAYRSRLVFDTRRAAHSFQLAVFSFQSFISDFTKSLEPSLGIDMVDVLNINNHILRERASHFLVSDKEQEMFDKVQELCSVEYAHIPQTKRSGFNSGEKAAKEALSRYMDASLLVFCGEMAVRGHASGYEDMVEIIQPLQGLLSAAEIRRTERGLIW
jgi:hypothetical protein